MDNVVRRGRVAIPDYSDEKVEGVRRLLEYLKSDDEVECTTISTVGEKVDIYNPTQANTADANGRTLTLTLGL